MEHPNSDQYLKANVRGLYTGYGLKRLREVFLPEELRVMQLTERQRSLFIALILQFDRELIFSPSEDQDAIIHNLVLWEVTRANENLPS